MSRIRNIHDADRIREEVTSRGERWRYINLNGDHLGVRIEELLPGDASSVHHYHTREEEHVLMLEGDAVLVLDDEELALTTGDHVWFPAGEEIAHHIENRGTDPVRILVFGERDPGDVVMYPRNGVMLVKAPEVRQYRYEPLKRS